MNHRTQQLINRQINHCAMSRISSSDKEEIARFQGYLLALWHVHKINRDEYTQYTQNSAEHLAKQGSAAK